MNSETIDHGNGVLQYYNEDTHGWTTWTDENDEIDEWNMNAIPGDRGSRSIHCVKINRDGHVRKIVGRPERYDWPGMAFWFKSEEDAHAFFETVRKATSIDIGQEEHRMPDPIPEEELLAL